MTITVSEELPESVHLLKLKVVLKKKIKKGQQKSASFRQSEREGWVLKRSVCSSRFIMQPSRAFLLKGQGEQKFHN